MNMIRSIARLLILSLALIGCASDGYIYSKPISPFVSGIPKESNSPPSGDFRLERITCKRNLLPARIQQPSATHSWQVQVASYTVNVMAFAQSENSVFFRVEGARGGTFNANLLVDSEGQASLGELRCYDIVISPI